jgi:two-component system response regulator (stage 0 sporulation protein F)
MPVGLEAGSVSKSETEILTTSQAAAFLAVHVQTVRRLARAGRIPCFRVGADWRFRKGALVQWADNRHLEDEEHGNGGACMVLIVDADEKVSAALARMAERFGCHTRQALSAEVGLELIAEEAPDLVLLDLKVPGINGLSFLRELRTRYRMLPVAIVTGYPDGELMTEALKTGPLMAVPKPVEPDQLGQVIRMAQSAKRRR